MLDSLNYLNVGFIKLLCLPKNVIEKSCICVVNCLRLMSTVHIVLYYIKHFEDNCTYALCSILLTYIISSCKIRHLSLANFLISLYMAENFLHWMMLLNSLFNTAHPKCVRCAIPCAMNSACLTIYTSHN